MVHPQKNASTIKTIYRVFKNPDLHSSEGVKPAYSRRRALLPAFARLLLSLLGRCSLLPARPLSLVLVVPVGWGRRRSRPPCVGQLRVSDILLPEGILLFRGYDPAVSTYDTVVLLVSMPHAP